MARIGILGGTFDPPHSAHIEIANHAMIERGYNKVVFLPSGSPPHKTAVSAGQDRLNMLRLAIRGMDKYEISTLEYTRSDNSGYTLDIIPLLIEEYGDDIEFIIGGDSMIDFHKWYKPLEIIKRVKLLVAVRDGDETSVRGAINAYKEYPKKGIEVLNYRPESLSSTRIRLYLQLGLDVDGTVADTVKDYINSNNLYNKYDLIRNRLKESIGETRYRHSINTVLTAYELLNAANVEDLEHAVTAALLHDCAKGIDSTAYLMIPKDALNTPVAHAFAGSIVAHEQYGVKDKDILDAIYYHTTAREDMTQLDKLIYLADMIEPSREFEGIEELRALAIRDFETAFCRAVDMTYNYLRVSGKEIYPLTVQAFNKYCK